MPAVAIVKTLNTANTTRDSLVVGRAFACRDQCLHSHFRPGLRLRQKHLLEQYEAHAAGQDVVHEGLVIAVPRLSESKVAKPVEPPVAAYLISACHPA